MKRVWALWLLLAFLFTAAPALGDEEDPLAKFAVKHGSRDLPRVALTVDDAFDLSYVWKIRDLFKEEGIVGTFFPIGKQLKEKDRDEWRKVIEYGNEIGSHNYGHYKMGNSSSWDIVSSLGRFQQQLDAVLGYHYGVNSFRPPTGNYADASGNTTKFIKAVRLFGYEHVVLWDVSDTKAESALKKVKNGSILLYHSRSKDLKCLTTLIPQLKELGYEFVTVSELLGFGPIETGDELYVYNKADYQKK